MTTDLAQVDGTEAQVQAISGLPRDLAIIKMENENIMALAAAHPRDYGEVLADIKNQLRTFKSFAETAMYNKPVGKEDGKMKYARGLSVRAAEAIATAYKFNRCRIDVTPMPDGARVEATFTDYQTGRMWQKAGLVSKRYKRKGGGIAVHNDDRFYGVVCEAAGSRLIRECILRCVPPGLRSELEKCVDEQLDEFLDESTAKKIVAQFSTKGIAQDQIETLLGKRLDSFTKEDRRTLLGTWNAIAQGETTIAEVFGDANRSNDAATGTRSEQLAKELAPPPVEAKVEGPQEKLEPEPEAPPTTEPPAEPDLTALREDVLARLQALPMKIRDAVLAESGLEGEFLIAGALAGALETVTKPEDLNDIKLRCADAAGKAKSGKNVKPGGE